MIIKTDMVSIIKDSLIFSMMTSAWQHFNYNPSESFIAYLSYFGFQFVLIFYSYTFLPHLVLKKYDHKKTALTYAIMLPISITAASSLIRYISTLSDPSLYTYKHTNSLWILGITMILGMIDLLKNKGAASKEFFTIFSGKWDKLQNCQRQ
jgi:hypothetical protein